MQTNTATVNGTPRFRDAFVRLEKDILAVPEGELTVVNIDIPTAVTTALGALPEIRALRARIVEELPRFDLARFDHLEDHTLAVAHAHTLYVAASQPSEPLPALNEEAVALRDILYSDASALAKRGLVDGRRLDEYKNATGYRNVAFDLFGLAAVMRQRWADVEGKTATTLADLDRAENLADRIVTAVGAKEQAPVAVAEAALTRQRAFTLFVESYDQARRAIAYLRWEQGDLDDIAPSLYAGRGGRKKSHDATSDVPASSAGAQAAAAAQRTSPGSIAAPSRTGGAIGTGPAGTPDSDPFLPA